MAVVEDEQEFGAVGRQALERVRVPRREIPEVTLFKVVDEIATFGVKSGDTNFTFEDIGPLGLHVPVKLSDDAFVQTHVDASELDAGGKFSNGGLPGPSSFLGKG